MLTILALFFIVGLILFVRFVAKGSGLSHRSDDSDRPTSSWVPPVTSSWTSNDSSSNDSSSSWSGSDSSSSDSGGFGGGDSGGGGSSDDWS